MPAKPASTQPSAPDPVDALTAAYADPHTQEPLTRELAKAVLSRGAWATVLFLVQEKDRTTQAFGPPKVSVRRYKKQGGSYRFQGAFNITGARQAQQMVDTLTGWFAPGGAGANALAELGPAAADSAED